MKIDNEEIRSVLMKHWTSLDRARLHTFHLWLFVYALAQIFLFHYLCHRVHLHIDKIEKEHYLHLFLRLQVIFAEFLYSSM